MLRRFFEFPRRHASPRGAERPRAGAESPIALLFLTALSGACADVERTRTLDPALVGMDETVAPIYDDGQLQIFEVKAEMELPLAAPDPESASALDDTSPEPYGRQPWITVGDVRVQITWTLSNLDTENHNVEILIDPWNEFGRYWPGVAVVDADAGETVPNPSGIDIMYELPGLDDPRESRIRGTFTFDDLEELATDFATVMNIIENVEPPADPSEAEEDPRVGLVNHAFHQNNHTGRDIVTDGYVPEIVAGLAGFDFGLRTREPANVALEIVVEVVDTGNERVLELDSDDPVLEVPADYITIGG